MHDANGHISEKWFAMPIIVATKANLAQAMSLIEACIVHMEGEGIHQWDKRYPSPELIGNDIAQGNLYLFRDGGELKGIAALNEEQSFEYGGVKWLTSGGKILVVHRLAVHPLWQRKGIAARLMDFAETHARRNGYTSIRLDVYTANPAAVRLYERRGYVRVGQVYFKTAEMPFFCYEKVMEV